MKIRSFLVILFISLLPSIVIAEDITVGAARTDQYINKLQDKRVAIFVNHSALVGNQHLIDVLRKSNISIRKIFVPEHGLTGELEGGALIRDGIDTKTKIPVISLYGNKLKPSARDLADIDIMIFDMQDVGVRFYTYISSLQKYMEAALENDKTLIILDRPNPNGFYVDGPVLEKRFKSFTGMQPIPFVHGMTVGEYARMLVGEHWLSVGPKFKTKQLKLIVIPCLNYTHKTFYEPPVSPSPSLPNVQAIYWYAAIGMLEDTALSVGRGTSGPFQFIGHPKFNSAFSFTPKSSNHAKHPPHENKLCFGWNLKADATKTRKLINHKLQLQFMINAYQAFHDKDNFFHKSFAYTVGNDQFVKQIRSGKSEQEIRQSWEPQLSHFKKIRKKYLLYPDFE